MEPTQSKKLTPEQAHWMIRNAWDYIRDTGPLTGHKEPQRRRVETDLKLLMESFNG